jgi:hexosaminidase
MHSLIPKPASIVPASGTFALSNATRIVLPNSDAELLLLGQQLSDFIQQHTTLQVKVATQEGLSGNIHFHLQDDKSFGEEGYELSITADAIDLKAAYATGLFYGIQTLQQIITAQRTTRNLPALSIADSPRFPWRGAMLDVARHFFSVEDIKRYIDLIAHYKMNRLHLHLSDDQGWRIEIKSWPKLTEIGAQTQVNGGGGGFYTKAQFKEIVDYAQSRYVMIIPEIDTPGHTNAALASYPQLNSSEEAPQLYEGTKVGFSSLWINNEITYQFLDDVIRELAEISPAPYIHIGGDEAHSTPEEDYKYYIKRIQQIVQSHGKQTIGWAEIGDAEILPGTVAQHWVNAGYQGAKAQGAKIILSPANKTYLDMKYDASSPLGLDWVGFISVKDAYDWEPASYMDLLEESDILGIEAPLWSETLKNIKDVEFLAFPRLAGLAELAWSPKGQTWDEYKQRLAKHGKHMEALNINFFKSPDVEWE